MWKMEKTAAFRDHSVEFKNAAFKEHNVELISGRKIIPEITFPMSKRI